MRMSALTLTFIVMGLLVLALVLLAFFAGTQYAAQRTASHQVPTAASSTPKTTKEDPRAMQVVPALQRITVQGKGASFVLGNPVTLTIGDSANTGSLSVVFTDVVYDGRCPENADCAVAGEAIVEVVVKESGREIGVAYLSTLTGGKSEYWATYPFKEDFADRETLQVIAKAQAIAQQTTYVPMGSRYKGSAGRIGSYTVYLESLVPGRLSQSEGILNPRKSDYKATLMISRAN